MKLDGYIRVSSVMGRDEAGTLISPDVQREKIEAWVKAHGHEIVEWHTDKDQTGRKKKGQKMSRPAFDRMMGRVDRGETGGVVVAKLNRFGRSTLGIAQELERIDLAGGMFKSVLDDVGGEKDSPTAKLMRTVLSAIAEFESDRIGQDWLDAQGKAISLGRHIGKAPVGYDRLHSGSLVSNAAGVHVTRAFEMRRDGATLTEIAAFLSSVTKPKRGAQFVASTVQRMLKNRTYLGEVRCGELVLGGAHEQLVSYELWEQVQALGGRPREAREERDSLLTGTVRCASCRYTLRVAGRGTPSEHYRCLRRHSAGNCPDPVMIRASEIEPFVERAARKHAAKITAPPAVRAAREALDAAQEQYDQWAGNLEYERRFGDKYLDLLEQRSLALDVARADYSSALTSASMPLTSLSNEEWDVMSDRERREAVALTVGAVFVRPGERLRDRVKILWSGQEPDDLPGRGNKKSDTITPLAW